MSWQLYSGNNALPWWMRRRDGGAPRLPRSFDTHAIIPPGWRQGEEDSRIYGSHSIEKRLSGLFQFWHRFDSVTGFFKPAPSPKPRHPPPATRHNSLIGNLRRAGSCRIVVGGGVQNPRTAAVLKASRSTFEHAAAGLRHRGCPAAKSYREWRKSGLDGVSPHRLLRSSGPVAAVFGFQVFFELCQLFGSGQFVGRFGFCFRRQFDVAHADGRGGCRKFVWFGGCDLRILIHVSGILAAVRSSRNGGIDRGRRVVLADGQYWDRDRLAAGTAALPGESRPRGSHERSKLTQCIVAATPRRFGARRTERQPRRLRFSMKSSASFRFRQGNGIHSSDLEHLHKSCSDELKSAVFLVFGFVSAQLQGFQTCSFTEASPKTKNPRCSSLHLSVNALSSLK